MTMKKLTQFSLLTFLIVTVVLGVGLGISGTYLTSSPPAVVQLTSDNFEELAISSKQPVLVTFRANWCPVCQKDYPLLEELAEDLHREAVIATVDLDDQPKLVKRFNVTAVPTFFVIRDGKVVAKKMGGGSDKKTIAALISP